MKPQSPLQYLASSVTIVVGLVLVWRGIWYVLDEFDKLLFGGGHMVTAIGGIGLGLLLLWLPDGNLKEIEKL